MVKGRVYSLDFFPAHWVFCRDDGRHFVIPVGRSFGGDLDLSHEILPYLHLSDDDEVSPYLYRFMGVERA